MADLIESEIYETGIIQLEITDPVIGGPDGKSNQQAKQLANRTNWLKSKIDALIAGAIVAAKAVQLETARKINGVNFNGTADITIYDGTKIGTAEIHASAAKATPVDADEFALVDSAGSFGLKKITWGNMKNSLASVFTKPTDYASADGITGGTIKARISGSTLYLTTNGTNA